VIHQWLELALALYLVVVLPGQALWQSLQPATKPKRPRLAAYRASIVRIVILLAILAALMWWSGRPAAALGLALPMSTAGAWGVIAAGILLSVMSIGGWLWERKLSGEKLAQYQAKLEKAGDSMPQTEQELKAFMLLTVFIGCGWELLYRGFLMMVLTPVIGTASAVALAAIAYGAAHGYQGRGQFIGSIVSAFLFTIGYVATGSLWWLMLLHTLLPIYSAVQYHRHKRSMDAAGIAPAAESA
jgi:membrane protease YdiL (CAAX protease family)